MKRLIFSLAALGLLAGCGIPGGLERPGPMWNSDEVLQRECTRPLGPTERRDPRCSEPDAPYIDDTAQPRTPDGERINPMAPDSPRPQ